MAESSVAEESPRCQYTWVMGCHHTEATHYLASGPFGRTSHEFMPPVTQPKPGEIAHASAVTEWDCPFCGEHNDVHGEGALYSWMECGKCFKEAYLVSEYDEVSRVGSSA